MTSYTRLTLAEREEISRSVAAGDGVRAMARQLGRAPSTIGRELRRAERTRSTYRATRGQHGARRTAQRPRKLVTNPRLQAAVHAQLAQRWSPEQIATRLKAVYPDDPTMRVSHEAIYAYVYVLPRGELKRTLLLALRHRRTARRTRRGTPERRGTIPAMLSIEERPAEVADRTVPGHWQSNCLSGQVPWA